MIQNALRKLSSIIGVMLLAYSAVVGYFWLQQRQLVFNPDAILLTTPARNGLKYEEVRIISGKEMEQGELVSWWIPAAAPNAPTILYFHGNSRNISLRPEVMRGMHELGYNQLLVDYRGYGHSTGGPPSEAKVYEDAEAAWNWLIKQRHAKPAHTFIYGHSLGGAIAADLAVRHPDAAGLVIESSFSSMAAMGEKDYGFLPIKAVLNQKFDTVSKISQLKMPLLILHGTNDQKIPWQMGRELYEHAPQPKKLIFITGAEHSNIPSFAWLEYRAALSQFVQHSAR